MRWSGSEGDSPRIGGGAARALHRRDDMRRAQLLDGGYVTIVERNGGWTYAYSGSRLPSEEEVPDIYSSPEEAEAAARNRFELELVSDFGDPPDDRAPAT